jgi:hypothetical protein
VSDSAPAASAVSVVPSWREAPFAWLAAGVGAVVLMLLPAVWNGYPFMFYDSGAFIEMAVQGGFIAERSAFYGMFLSAFGPRFSLWPAMIAQVSMTVLVMAAFARALLPGLSPARFFVLGVLLILGTGLPWFASEVLPDILAPLLALCLYLLAFHGTALTWPHKVALIAVAILGVTSHASHLGLAAGLVIVIALMQVATRRLKLRSVAPRVALPAFVVALSLILMVVSNFARTGDIFISRSGPAFMLGRLVQDGIVKRLLDDTCPQSGYRLCAYKDSLPKLANDFLWGGESPFREQLGGFEGMADESSSIIHESLKRYPLMHVETALTSMLEQMVTFRTGDGLAPLSDIPVPAIKLLQPEQLADYRASRQQRDLLSFDWINAVQVPLGALSIVGLVVILGQAARRRDWTDRLFLPAFLLFALLGNAFICGVLSNPQHRYQSRLMWAVSFAVMLLLLGRRSRAWTAAMAALKSFLARFIGPPDVGVAT